MTVKFFRIRSVLPPTEREFMFRSRPFGVTLLLWLVLSLSAWGAVRFLAALRWWDVLNEFEARLSPLYLSITGAGWIVAGMVLLWALFSAKSWFYRAIPIAISLWLFEYWVERIFFESSRANLPFALIASLLLFALTLVSSFNRRTKEFFIKSEDHEQPIEDTDSARA
jgi:hypothetical protein